MCGICGEVGWDETAPVDMNLLAAMNRSMAHRGPDGEGFYLDPTGKVGLGHRRLSIIDIEGGHQPMCNEDGSIHVVFNGEIYNFLELRPRLEASGHQFKTRSDTEVLIHLYEQVGTEMLHQIKGMFAFCIYDERKKMAFLARDRFGEKPLHYYLTNGSLYFSSEIVGLMCRPDIPRKLNWDGLAYYVRYGCTPSPITLFEGIHSLEPGSAMVYHEGKVRIWQYFHIDFSPKPELADPQVAEQQILDALRKSVRRQRISDAPIGVFLSGGIDSSTVAALMRDEVGPGFRTFNVRFSEKSYDEGPIAQLVADKLGTAHLALTAVDQQFVEDDFWRIIAHVGQPFLDSSAIPTAIMCKNAREHVKVCLSGDGGDEVFAGYTVFGWGLHAHQFSRFPRILASCGSKFLSFATQLPWLRSQRALRQLRKGLRVLSVPWNRAFAKLHEAFTPAELGQLTQNDARSCLELPVDDRFMQLPSHVSKWTPLRQMMYWRIRFALASDMLVMVDRMAMANSLEVRAPFLDPDLFTIAAGLPDNFLWRNGCGKWIIRRALKDKLPPAVFDHPKTGFMIPLHRLHNENYRKLTAELFSTESFRSIFKPEMVERIRNHTLELKRDNAQTSLHISSHRLWMLAQLAGWLQYFNVSIA